MKEYKFNLPRIGNLKTRIFCLVSSVYLIFPTTKVYVDSSEFGYTQSVTESTLPQNTNQSLIYHWDVHHKVHYYCQFGTKQEIHSYPNEMQCFEQNRGMQHITPEGIQTYPYLKYGAHAGFVLKCPEVAEVRFHDCNRFVYQSCYYSCTDADVMNLVTCQLKGPRKNVTALWSVFEFCARGQNSTDGYVSSVSATSSEPDYLTSIKNETTPKEHVFHISSSEVNTTRVLYNSTTESSLLVSTEKDTLIAIVIPVVISTLLIAAFLSFIFFRRWKRKRINFRVEFSKNNFEVDKFDGCTSQLKTEKENNNNINTAGRISPSFDNAENSSQPTTGEMLSLADGKDLFDNCPLINIRDLESIFPDKTKMEIELTEMLSRVKPDLCNETVSMFGRQGATYRKKLRAELEVIPGRLRNQTLVGYVEKNYTSLGFGRLNEIKVLEQTFANQLDPKVSDHLLEILAAYGMKIGSLMEYFYQTKNTDAIHVILEVHSHCQYCEIFRKLCPRVS